MITLLALLTAAYAGPATDSPSVEEQLAERARDTSLDADQRLRAAMALIALLEEDTGHEYVLEIPAPKAMPDEIDPCDDDDGAREPTRPAANLTRLAARPTADGSLHIDAQTDRPVRAMHYLHERGDQRHWVLWLEGVDAPARQIDVPDDIATTVRVLSREDRGTAIVATLDTDAPLRVVLEQIDGGWRLVLNDRAPGLM